MVKDSWALQGLWNAGWWERLWCGRQLVGWNVGLETALPCSNAEAEIEAPGVVVAGWNCWRPSDSAPALLQLQRSAAAVGKRTEMEESYADWEVEMALQYEQAAPRIWTLITWPVLVTLGNGRVPFILSCLNLKELVNVWLLNKD